MGLATKLSVALTLSIFAVVGLSSAWSAHESVERLETYRRTQLSARADLLAEGAREVLREDGEDKARWLLRQMRDAVDDGRVFWLGAHPGRPPEFRGDDEAWELLRHGRGVGPLTDADGRFTAVYRPVMDGQTLRGVVAVESSARATRGAVRAMLWERAVMALLLALVCALVIFAAIHVLVRRPLDEIRSQVRRIASDDLTSRIRVRGRDQVGDLANDLNELTAVLELAHARIEQETRRRVAALAQLRHAGRLKVVGQLTASVAHEMGTPLNVVAGRARMIARGVASGEQALESAEIIERQAARMADRIRHLLGFARRRTAPRAVVDLRLVAEEALELLGPMMHSATVAGALRAEGDGPWRVEGDAAELEQVLVNLMANALQAMEGGGRLELLLRREAGGDGEPDRVLVDVADTGPGIPPEVRARIFEPFFTTKVDADGTGLGLSVALDIVREHAGTLRVESEPGQGARFTMSLPAAD